MRYDGFGCKHNVVYCLPVGYSPEVGRIYVSDDETLPGCHLQYTTPPAARQLHEPFCAFRVDVPTYDCESFRFP